MVLPWDHEDWATHGGGDILADGVDVLRPGLRLQHLIRTNLQIAQEHLLHIALVIHLGHNRRPLHDRLNLCKPLCLAKDRRVADWNDVHWAIKVRRLNIQTRLERLDIFVCQVSRIDAVQYLEHTRHR